MYIFTLITVISTYNWESVALREMMRCIDEFVFFLNNNDLVLTKFLLVHPERNASNKKKIIKIGWNLAKLLWKNKKKFQMN